MQDIGAILRERREALGLNLADVEAGIRIRQKYLAALESDDWHQLPGEVVGRGFLRNYARFLDLDPETLMDRRRVSVDPHLQHALESTSAGAPMPVSREVDYRPRDVALTREPLIDFDDIVIDWRRVTRFLTIPLLILLVALVWWGFSQIAPGIGSAFGGMIDGVRTQIAELRSEDAITPTPASLLAAGTSGGAGESLGSGEATPTQPADGSGVLAPTATPQLPTATFTPEPPTATPTVAPTEIPAVAPVVEQPVDTPTPELPPVQPVEEPVVETAVEEPVEEPTPEFPPPACTDERSVILSPGVNQIVQGQVIITGTVFHDDFWYYKLEFAPGANAREGFVYFAGAENQLQAGTLARLNSAALGNGTYTIKLTVVDNTGNFPAPCQVTIRVAN